MFVRATFGMYITDLHTCKVLFTCLVRTRGLCKRASISSVSHAHTCIYTSEIKMCRVEYMVHTCSVKVKLSCTVCIKYEHHPNKTE